jgi:hypothetical protein
MDAALALCYLSIFVVFASHAYMVMSPGAHLGPAMLRQHCYMNMAAAAVIAYYVWSRC